uniref:Retrotransposon gag domain-containing protein n=1 Tax=Cajanus cajan TaxID=3821 RepID=A0A151THP2_CAJCA|nr:hypothetical protein KK1_012855 [Cajanus cajan]
MAQRGKLLLLSMDGKAFSWQRHYMQQPRFKDKSWEQILQDVAYRFDDSAFDDPVAELARLKQEGDLGEYLETFDSLLARVAVTESMALSTSQRSHSITNLQQNHPMSSMSSPVTSDSKINTSASISRKEVSDRIAKGLCRFCGDKWDKNHKMKCKVWGKLNAIFSAQEEIAEDIMQDKDCEEEQAIVDRSIAMIQDEEVHISLNALQGIAGGNTLQLKGLIKHQKVPFLMDTGSTHNFISDKWAMSKNPTHHHCMR